MDILRAENINNNSCYKNIEKDNRIVSTNCYAENSIFSFEKSDKFNYPNNLNIFTSSNTSNSSTESLKEDLEKTRDEQGLIGKLWDGFKNLTGIGAGSNKAEAAIEQYENGEITYEEAQEKLENYKKGQETVVDVAGDIVSGIVAVGAFALAVPTGGTSLIAGLGLAAIAGAGTKIAVKAGDAIVGGRDYTGKDLLYDTATGAINGLFAPITNGIGACVTKTVGSKLGLTVVKEGTQEIIEQTAKQSIKSIITQQGVDVIGGTFAKRALATAAGMAVDGAIGGSTDNMIRAALDGEDLEGILEAGAEGAVGGLIMAPVIGGGFKVAGKLGKSINNKITTSSVFSDGMDTAFKQGETGDCALLSFINGAMKSDDAQDLIKKSITKSAFGDYHIKIGNQTVDIPVSSLTDDILSDTTGIKLFEAAYKKIGGSLDGEFAESVAKQFGLNPIHIASDSITDETLDKIAKEQGIILSLGTKIDADGNISTNGTNHYFSIQDVDTLGKKVNLTDPYDTSKLIELSYDDIKKFGISIDGGSIKETNLPNSARNTGDVNFKGKETKTYTSTCKDMSNSKAQKEMKRLIAAVANGEVKIEDLTDEQILDIWSWRLYDRPLENTPELQAAFIERFDKICNENLIDITPEEMLLRTIPESPELEYSKPFSIGKPDKTGKSWPAAAARVKMNDDGSIPEGVMARIIDDKYQYMLRNPGSELPDSTLYIIDPTDGQELTGFDWHKTGVTCDKLTGEKNGFGSSAFRKEVDSQGYSTEVNFSGNTQFAISEGSEIASIPCKLENGTIFYVNMIHITPKK